MRVSTEVAQSAEIGRGVSLNWLSRYMEKLFEKGKKLFWLTIIEGVLSTNPVKTLLELLTV